MRYVVSILPIVAVILFNVMLAPIFNVEPASTAFLIWCFVSGFIAGWIGAEIYLEW